MIAIMTNLDSYIIIKEMSCVAFSLYSLLSLLLLLLLLLLFDHEFAASFKQ